MANALPLLLGGAAAVYFYTRKKPKPSGGNGKGETAGGGGTAGGGAEPAIGDTVDASVTPQNGIMWKVVKSPGGYTAKWMDIHEKVWHTVEGEFKTPSEAKLRVVDMIGLGQIP
jgi:hypothetical protein